MGAYTVEFKAVTGWTTPSSGGSDDQQWCDGDGKSGPMSQQLGSLTGDDQFDESTGVRSMPADNGDGLAQQHGSIVVPRRPVSPWVPIRLSSSL